MNNSGVWSELPPSRSYRLFWVSEQSLTIWWSKYGLLILTQSLMSKPPPRPGWTLSWSLRRTCQIVITRRNVALSRESVTEASSEVVSEEAPERDLDSRNTRTNYTFTFGPGAEVLRLLLLLCFITSHYTWSLFFHKSVTSIIMYSRYNFIPGVAGLFVQELQCIFLWILGHTFKV